MFIAIIIALLVLLPLIALKLLSFTGSAPTRPDLVTELPDCPASPNCVSSTATDTGHRVEPFTYPGAGATALEQFDQVAIAAGATLVRSTDRYRHYTFRSRWMGYVDDVEVLLEAEKNELALRSASRSGYGDFGVNRRRVEILQKAFNARQGGQPD